MGDDGVGGREKAECRAATNNALCGDTLSFAPKVCVQSGSDRPVLAGPTMLGRWGRGAWEHNCGPSALGFRLRILRFINILTGVQICEICGLDRNSVLSDKY